MQPPQFPSMQSDQLDAVSVFAPWAGPEERKLRLRIHKARDVAVARATRSHHANARTLYWMASDIASAIVFARASEDTLRDTLAFLTRQFQNAGWVERNEAPDER